MEPKIQFSSSPDGAAQLDPNQAELPPTVPLPMGPAVNAMSGQEIRTRALEASVRLWAGYGIRAEEGDDPVTREFWRTVGQFEAYIRDGG